MIAGIIFWITDSFMLFIQIMFVTFSPLLLLTFVRITYIERKKTKSMLRFHSAEHMIINAYKELHRIPTIEEARKYSRFNNNCGTNEITRNIIICNLVCIFSFILEYNSFIIAVIISIIVVNILVRSGLFNFVQKFTTLPTTDKELKVAIEGLKLWIEHEEND